MLVGKCSSGNVPEGSRLAPPSYEWLCNIIITRDHARRLECVNKLKVLAETVVGCTAAPSQARARIAKWGEGAWFVCVYLLTSPLPPA